MFRPSRPIEERMQVDDQRCSFPRQRCGGDLQLEVRARLMSATAQVMSRPCQQSVRSALACVGRCSLILCAVGHRVPPRVAHLDECRVPSPAASIGPSPAHLGGCLGLASRLGGGEARRFEAGYAICVPRLAAQRRFAVCAEDDDRLVQRRRATFPGHWEPYLHALHTPNWFHDER